MFNILNEILVKDIRKKNRLKLTFCKPTISVNLIHMDKTYWYLFIIFVDNVFCSVVTMLLEWSLGSCTCRHSTNYLSYIRMLYDTLWRLILSSLHLLFPATFYAGTRDTYYRSKAYTVVGDYSCQNVSNIFSIHIVQPFKETFG